MQTPTVTTVPAIYVGGIFADRKSGALYKAVKLNSVNIKALSVSGNTWNVPWSLAREATPDEVARFTAKWEGTHDADTTLQKLQAGNVVQFVNPTKPASEGIFVVTKYKGAAGVTLVRLGGDSEHRYFPTVPVHLLELVNGEVTVTNV